MSGTVGLPVKDIVARKERIGLNSVGCTVTSEVLRDPCLSTVTHVVARAKRQLEPCGTAETVASRDTIDAEALFSDGFVEMPATLGRLDHRDRTILIQLELQIAIGTKKTRFAGKWNWIHRRLWVHNGRAVAPPY